MNQTPHPPLFATPSWYLLSVCSRLHINKAITNINLDDIVQTGDCIWQYNNQLRERKHKMCFSYICFQFIY